MLNDTKIFLFLMYLYLFLLHVYNDYLFPDTCKQAIIPLVKKFCENSLNSKDSTLPVVSKQLGQLCHGLVCMYPRFACILLFSCLVQHLFEFVL